MWPFLGALLRDGSDRAAKASKRLPEGSGRLGARGGGCSYSQRQKDAALPVDTESQLARLYW